MIDNFDLIPFPENIKTLFILGSPFKDELTKGYPCAGKTGKNMALKILGDGSEAFGEASVQKSLTQLEIKAIIDVF
jgi:hypothetical protein